MKEKEFLNWHFQSKVININCNLKSILDSLPEHTQICESTYNVPTTLKKAIETLWRINYEILSRTPEEIKEVYDNLKQQLEGLKLDGTEVFIKDIDKICNDLISLKEEYNILSTSSALPSTQDNNPLGELAGSAYEPEPESTYDVSIWHFI